MFRLANIIRHCSPIHDSYRKFQLHRTSGLFKFTVSFNTLDKTCDSYLCLGFNICTGFSWRQTFLHLQGFSQGQWSLQAHLLDHIEEVQSTKRWSLWDIVLRSLINTWSQAYELTKFFEEALPLHDCWLLHLLWRGYRIILIIICNSAKLKNRTFFNREFSALWSWYR